MVVTYLEKADGDPKFWQMEVKGSKTTAKWGKQGTPGNTSEKDHGTAAEAQAFADKQILAKRKTGFYDGVNKRKRTGDGEATTPSKRGRGRPKKIADEEEEEDEEEEPKKGRGRPRGSSSTPKKKTGAKADKGTPAKDTPSKRGRGRPRKDSTEEAAEEEEEEDVEEEEEEEEKVTPRKRGRPKKSTSTSASPKRGRPKSTPASPKRGRPSKSASRGRPSKSSSRGRPSKSASPVRGRPRKAVSASREKKSTRGATTSASGRPRGRPKGSSTSTSRGRPKQTTTSSGRVIGKTKKSLSITVTMGGAPIGKPKKVTTSSTRGRPKKITSTSAKRGRPSKSTTGKPRGRPKKAGVKRGRPSKKDKEDEEMEEVEEEEEEEEEAEKEKEKEKETEKEKEKEKEGEEEPKTPGKRGRGRPKKGEVTTPGDVEEPKAKRGRPSKSSTPSTPTSPRGRGRGRGRGTPRGRGSRGGARGGRGGRTPTSASKQTPPTTPSTTTTSTTAITPIPIPAPTPPREKRPIPEDPWDEEERVKERESVTWPQKTYPQNSVRGPVVWSTQIHSKADSIFGIYVDAEHVYAGNEAGVVAQLNKDTGVVLKKYMLPAGVKCIVGDGGFLYAGCNNGSLYDITQGVPRLMCKIEEFGQIYWMDVYQGLIAASDDNGAVALINSEGETIWVKRFAKDGSGWMCRIDDAGVYVGTNNGVAKRALSDGSVIWKTSKISNILFGYQTKDFVYGTSSRGYMAKLDKKTGEIVTQFKHGGPSTAASEDGELVVSGFPFAIFDGTGNCIADYDYMNSTSSATIYNKTEVYTVGTEVIRYDFSPSGIEQVAKHTWKRGPENFLSSIPTTAAIRPQETVTETTDTSGGVMCECVKDGSKLRMRVITPGYNQDWNVQFPQAIREAGAKYVVEKIIESTRGGFYRAWGDIKKVKQ